MGLLHQRHRGQMQLLLAVLLLSAELGGRCAAAAAAAAADDGADGAADAGGGAAADGAFAAGGGGLFGQQKKAFECASTCHEHECATVGLRYGKYCGVGHGGCPGEEPCDAADACCREHDACVEQGGALAAGCHAAFVACLDKAAEEHGAEGGFSAKCPWSTVLPVMKGGIMAGNALGQMFARMLAGAAGGGAGAAGGKGGLLDGLAGMLGSDKVNLQVAFGGDAFDGLKQGGGGGGDGDDGSSGVPWLRHSGPEQSEEEEAEQVEAEL